MSQIYSLMYQHKRIARVFLVVIIPVAVIAAMTATAVLFIPGAIEGVNEVRYLSTYLFIAMVVLGTITASCSLVWVLGPVWREVGVAFGLERLEDPEREEVAS